MCITTSVSLRKYLCIKNIYFTNFPAGAANLFEYKSYLFYANGIYKKKILIIFLIEVSTKKF